MESVASEEVSEAELVVERRGSGARVVVGSKDGAAEVVPATAVITVLTAPPFSSRSSPLWLNT